MPGEDFKRKLAAILHADVKGYSRLIGEDEEATVGTLRTYREAMGLVIRKHRGRVVHGSGDSLLAEFVSVVDAVRSAVEIQEELQARNAELPENRKVEFRIGINLGDVIEEGEDLHGDGVNIAARIESLADPGGICIARGAYDQVKNKLALGYEYLGEHTVKNIAEPVRVYKVITDPEAVGKVIGEKELSAGEGNRAAIAVVNRTPSAHRGSGDLEILPAYPCLAGGGRLREEDGIPAAGQTIHCCTAVSKHERRP